MKLYGTVLLTLFLLVGHFSAQESKLTYEKRIEFDLKEGENVRKTIPIGNEGLLLYTQPDGERKAEQKSFSVHKYNTDFVEVDSREIIVPFKSYANKSYFEDNVHYDFYMDNKSKEVEIFSIDIKSLSITSVKSKMPPKMVVNGFLVSGQTAFVTGYIKKDEILVTVDVKSGKHNVIPLVFGELDGYRVSIESLSKMYDSNEVLIFLTGTKKKEKKTLVVLFDSNGEKKEQLYLSKEVDKNLVSISGTLNKEGEYIFTGTYSSSSTSTAEGIYFCSVKGGKVSFINYINYLDLNNFTNYLTQKKQDKIEKKKAKKEAQGKELKIPYRMASHPIITTNDGYLFLGECYYPTYRTETYTTYVNGKPVTQTRQVFDGYQYTHASLVKYNKQGEKVWDEIFDMLIINKPFYVRRFIHLAEDTQESIKMVYSDYKYIKTKEFDWNGKLLEEESSTEIETGVDGDKTKYSNTQIDFWFDNYFINYGSQMIKNKSDDKDEDVKKKRYVYFLSKIKF